MGKWIQLGCGFLLLGLTSQVQALQVLGVSIPQTIEVMDNAQPLQLTLHGTAVRYLWGKPAYIGVLYTQYLDQSIEQMLSKDQAIRMAFYVVQDHVKPLLLQDAWVEGIFGNNERAISQEYAEQFLQLKAQLDNELFNGDVAYLQYLPQTGILMEINGQPKLQLQQQAKAFFNMAIKIWIGPHPPSLQFKRSLLNFPSAT